MLIRFLSILTFLIFLCPFFQTCSEDGRFKKVTKKYEHRTENFELSQNAYQLSIFDNISEISYNYGWPFYHFTAIILGAVTSLILSFRNHFNALRLVCYLNLFLAFSFLALMFICLVLEDFNQVKYGFYLFILNTITIIILSKKITNDDVDQMSG
jgi:hypothetical protein